MFGWGLDFPGDFRISALPGHKTPSLRFRPAFARRITAADAVRACAAKRLKGSLRRRSESVSAARKSRAAALQNLVLAPLLIRPLKPTFEGSGNGLRTGFQPVRRTASKTHHRRLVFDHFWDPKFRFRPPARHQPIDRPNRRDPTPMFNAPGASSSLNIACPTAGLSCPGQYWFDGRSAWRLGSYGTARIVARPPLVPG